MTKQKFTSKRERFLHVAEARTNVILEKIRILGNCSNRSLYEYNKEEIDKIFKAVQEKLNETKARFVVKKEKGFKLTA
jgi:hypothetical protein